MEYLKKFIRRVVWRKVPATVLPKSTVLLAHLTILCVVFVKSIISFICVSLYIIMCNFIVMILVVTKMEKHRNKYEKRS